MFVKIFAQIFDSSISEDYLTRLVFMDLLVLADAKGTVDMTVGAISRRTNVPLDIVSRAIRQLSEPDPTSRSETHEGRRLVPLDSHRDWGWEIVNYQKYREILDEEGRRSYWREYSRKRRSSVRDNPIHVQDEK